MTCMSAIFAQIVTPVTSVLNSPLTSTVSFATLARHNTALDQTLQSFLECVNLQDFARRRSRGCGWLVGAAAPTCTGAGPGKGQAPRPCVQEAAHGAQPNGQVSICSAMSRRMQPQVKHGAAWSAFCCFRGLGSPWHCAQFSRDRMASCSMRVVGQARPAGRPVGQASGSRMPQPGQRPLFSSRSLCGRPASQQLGSSKLSRRHEAQWIAAAGGGDGGSSGGAGGSGGGGGGGDDGDDGEQPQKKPVFGWKGWQDRVAADPQFVYKVMIEQIIGVSASVVGDMASRPNWGLNELDFVFATLVVGSIVNFSLMYLLAPVASAAGAGAKLGLVQKIFGEHYLAKWGAPTGHLFEPGYGLGSRLVNFGYKGAVFAFIGMCAGLVGTATSNGLLELRKKMDPTFAPANEPPSIVGNASCWALHMGFSSNLRYQMLNGIDMILQPIMPSTLFRLFTSVVRGLNNMVGGVSFVMIAKALGVQKAAEAAPEPAAAPADSKKKKK
ncbi:hypothetical protein ABPG75_007901 [Micractinium tetrahymenae]